MQEETEKSNLVDLLVEEKLAEESILKQSLEEKNKTIKELEEKILRIQADFDNFRKRTEKEKEYIKQIGKESIIKKILYLKDALEQAYQFAQNSLPQDIITGLEILNKEFSLFLKNEGVKEINSIGEKFSPDLHFVVETSETTNNQEDGIIFEEIQKGYLLNDQILRPAKVKIFVSIKNENHTKH